MLRICLPVIFGLAIVSTVSAGEAEKFFSERSKDFGTVPFGNPQVHHFKITNTSNQIVRIASARVSCGCTTATIPVNTLKPNESTYLTASMDTKRFVGPKEVIVYVTFSNPAEEVSLSVKANRNDNFSKSSEFITLPQTRKGGSTSASMQITMRNDPNFTVTSANTNTDFVVASAKLVKRERFEVVYEIVSELKPGLDVGMWTTDITVVSSNPAASNFKIPVNVEIVAPITATPAQVQFPAVKVGDSKELVVVVRGDKPFKIVEVKGGDGLIKAVSDSTTSKQAHIVRLVFKPSEAGENTKNLVVVTDNGTEGKVTIPVKTSAKMD